MLKRWISAKIDLNTAGELCINTGPGWATSGENTAMSVIGRIHSFESCGTVDGPGIRFITFFQGCLMRCLYCHNRDTWDTHGGKEITVEDLMKDVVTYRHFMNASGGGVTASGGKPFCRRSLSATGSAPAKRGHSYLSRY
jgi:pyruvate formate lyase activating enzyme